MTAETKPSQAATKEALAQNPPSVAPDPHQKKFFESLVTRMEGLQNQNRDLLDQLAEGAEYTPIEQESLPEDIIGGSRALDEFLATTHWPESVQGCILVQEIVVLPPEAESDLDHATAPVLTDQHAADEVARLTADAHPDRREARLFVGVLRDGPSLSLLQMRPDEDADPYGDLELLTYDGLAPHLVHALYATLDEVEED